MPSAFAALLEPLSNVLNAASVVAANRNSAHTWWTGIVGAVLLAVVFAGVRLYADVTLMLFFVVTGAVGWWRWRFGGEARTELPVTHATRRDAALTLLFVAVVVGATAACSTPSPRRPRPSSTPRSSRSPSPRPGC
jgi:nicotinamide mononucleotide transporter